MGYTRTDWDSYQQYRESIGERGSRGESEGDAGADRIGNGGKGNSQTPEGDVSTPQFSLPAKPQSAGARAKSNANRSRSKTFTRDDATSIAEAVTEDATRTDAEKVQDGESGTQFSLSSKKITAEMADEGDGYQWLNAGDIDEYLKVGKTLHTRHKKERLLENNKSPILTSDGEIRDFISDAIHGNARGEVRAFAKVPKRLSDAVSRIRDSLVLDGHYMELPADALRESYVMHASPKEIGDIHLSDDDFKNIHRTMFDFDGVLSINNHNKKTEIHIYRKTDGGYYQIITVVSSERKSLLITKIIGVSDGKFERKFAKKIERDTGSPRMQEASIPPTEARNTAGALSNVSIHQSSQKINPSAKKTSEKVSTSGKPQFSLPAKSQSAGARAKSNADRNRSETFTRKDAALIAEVSIPTTPTLTPTRRH